MRRKGIIYGLTPIVIAFVIFMYQAAGQLKNTRTVLKIRDNYELAPINPREVFLLFTKTPKTSSTVAASLIMEAYTRNRIPIANYAIGTNSNVPGTYASICHMPFSHDAVDRIVRITGKPVLLVVSIRDGYDWLKSFTAKAHTETEKVSRGSYVQKRDLCKRFSPPHSIIRLQTALWTYSRFLPVNLTNILEQNSTIKAEQYELTYTPWSVIRHEHVVDDTCELLKRLGMQCNRDAAFGQASRKQIGLEKCNFTPDSTIIDGVNKMNEILWTSRAEHDKIKRA